VRSRPLAAAALVVAALAASNCGGVTDPSKNTTETFSGTVAPRGQGQIHTFNVGNTGEYSIKVTAMTPTFNSFFVLTLASGDCSLLVNQNTLTVGQLMTGPIFQKGTYCVFLSDGLATMTTNENYTLTVSHP
jgi:hypothetical protein